MKVLHINAVYGVGSTGKIVRDLHELSLEQNIESYVAYSIAGDENNRIVNGYKIGSFFEKKLHAVLSRIGGKQAYYSRVGTKIFLKYLNVIQPDIVHLHNLHSNYINLNMVLSYLAKKDISTIITLHDCWFYTGGCFHYTNAECMKWKRECSRCAKQYSDTPALFKDCSNSIFNDRKKYFAGIKKLAVVGVSEWISKEAMQSIVLNNHKHFIIQNGIDTLFFQYSASDFRTKYNLEKKFVILGMANKWCDPVNKEALEYFNASHTKDMVLVIAGCSNLSSSKREGDIIYLPYITSQKQLRDIYSAADVFVNVTREESLSLVNVEAQSCGTPVITYDNTGVKETVDGMSGYRVTTGDVVSLFSAIMKVKKNGKHFYSEKCRNFVVKNFNRDTNYLKYLDLYKQLYKLDE